MLIQNLVSQIPTSGDVKSLNSEDFLKMLGLNPNDIDLRNEKILNEAVVNACIRIRSETIAKLPIKIYKKNKKVDDHYLCKLLKLRPNPYMSAYTYKKTVETLCCIHGNAYVYIDFSRRTGRVKGLYPLENERVKIYVDDVGILGKANSIYYVYTSKEGKQYKIENSEIMHTMGITFNGIVGIPPWLYLKGIIESSKQSQEYLREFYKNGLQTKGIIQYVGDLSDKAQETFRDKFESMSSGLKNAHRVSLLPIGYSFMPISSSMTDAQFLENTKLTTRQIASAFGIKMHQINEMDRATYSNVEQAQKDFYIETVQPIVTGYEQEADYKLFLDSELEEGYYTKYNVDAILRSDPKTRAETNKINLEAGIKTTNEGRADEDLEPVPGGDVLLGNGNLIPRQLAGIQYLSKFKDLESLNKILQTLKEVISNEKTKD